MYLRLVPLTSMLVSPRRIKGLFVNLSEACCKCDGRQSRGLAEGVSLNVQEASPLKSMLLSPDSRKASYCMRLRPDGSEIDDRLEQYMKALYGTWSCVDGMLTCPEPSGVM